MNMLPSFANDVVTVERAALVASRGTYIQDWANAVSRSVSGCSFQPVQGSTAWTDPRQAVSVRAVLYLPPETDIQAGDRVSYGGMTYGIDGAPQIVTSPTGAVSHIVCSLVDWVL